MFLREFFFLQDRKLKFGPFLESCDLMNPIGCNSSQLSSILSFCGFDYFIHLEMKKKSILLKMILKKYQKK